MIIIIRHYVDVALSIAPHRNEHRVPHRSDKFSRTGRVSDGHCHCSSEVSEFPCQARGGGARPKVKRENCWVCRFPRWERLTAHKEAAFPGSKGPAVCSILPAKLAKSSWLSTKAWNQVWHRVCFPCASRPTCGRPEPQWTLSRSCCHSTAGIFQADAFGGTRRNEVLPDQAGQHEAWRIVGQVRREKVINQPPSHSFHQCNPWCLRFGREDDH